MNGVGKEKVVCRLCGGGMSRGAVVLLPVMFFRSALFWLHCCVSRARDSLEVQLASVCSASSLMLTIGDSNLAGSGAVCMIRLPPRSVQSDAHRVLRKHKSLANLLCAALPFISDDQRFNHNRCISPLFLIS